MRSCCPRRSGSFWVYQQAMVAVGALLWPLMNCTVNDHHLDVNPNWQLFHNHVEIQRLACENK